MYQCFREMYCFSFLPVSLHDMTPQKNNIRKDLLKINCHGIGTCSHIVRVVQSVCIIIQDVYKPFS
jgi:hypothetical protein